MLAARQQIYDQDARTVFLNANSGSQGLGQVAETPDGRVYQYTQAGAANLAAGLLVQASATTANHITQTGTANAIGSTAVTYTIGATAAAQDLYGQGYFAVTVGPGQNVYQIIGNTAVAAGGGSITVTLEDPLTVATTTASKFTLMPHPNANVIVTPGSGAGIPVVGVPNVAVTATYYFWAQVGGYAAVLSAGAIAKDTGATPSLSVSGAAVTEATGTIVQRIGYAPELTVDTAYWPLMLQINPAV